MKGRWTPLVAVFSAAAAYVASGAQPPPAPQPPTFRTEANYVRVDAYPTKDGAPIADLTQPDFEVLENGVPQRIEQFERVAIRGNLPQDLRAEPKTVRESLAMAANPRARLFVVFLDTYHVDVGASHNIRKPLMDALDRLIGQDDLVAVMTPQMPASGIAFARRTTTIEGFLARHWDWGDRDRTTVRDPEDEAYGVCYPNEPPGSECTDQNGIAAEMIDRRHEKITIDAIQDLVRYLRGLREERKAVLAISNGWLLYRPDQRLARPLACHGIPGVPPVGFDPRTGRLTGKDVSTAAAPRGTCDQDRMSLSNLDDDQKFRDVLGEANRANVSFYPVDPRGLTSFDTPLVRQDVSGPPPPMVPPSVDSRMLAGRLNSLRTLAEATDGLAIVDSNNLAGGMKRIVDDLSSYYLLGYYSNAKLDGKFHAITVRVKRPGVQVRARRGYLAATPAAMTAAARAGAAPAADPAAAAKAAAAHAIDAVVAPLAGYTRDVPLRLQLAAGWPAGGGGGRPPTIWVVGEIGGVATIGDAWADGFDATATLTTPAGADVASGRATVARGGRTFRIALAPPTAIEPGELVLRVSARAGAASIPSRESARVTIPAPPEATGALFVRRGPATGNKEAPTADVRFRRSEQLRVEIPAASGDPPTARLLDRSGNPLNVPVAAARRNDPDGSQWVTAQLALAPLAPGDYVIEIATGDRRSISAFRVVP
ncbi:MAG: hypothetical protein DMF93_00135 [Acidobacteria bacterium]|nr:MAG: hypothetical protein DMF93_00135 [Acidobacteriota bacterium]